MNIRTFILTEGSTNTGFGHITRCISLYQAFKENGIVPEFFVNGDESIKDLLRDLNHKIFNWLREQEILFNLLKIADIVVIDSYLADYEFYKKISESVKVPVYIDDNKRLEYPEGIVINGVVNAKEFQYLEKKGVTYLLGSQYIPLRKEFWDVPEKEIRENIENILITFGGDDMKNMTPKALKILVDNFPEVVKNVIIGKGFKNIEEIKSVVDRRTNLIYYPDAEGMKKTMLNSDIAISAGGQTLYELAKIGVPTIAIAVSDNQINNVVGWQRTSFIDYAGWWEDEGIVDNITKSLNKLKNRTERKKRAEIGMEIINGQGAIRIVKYCMEKYFEESIVIRNAELRDMHNIYELANDNEIRKNSFNQDKIEFEDHKNWFVNKLKDKNCLFVVAEANNNFIGQVRFDIRMDEAVISISINKNFRGLGIGTVTIKKALDYLKSLHSTIKVIKAYTKKTNVSSIKLFEKSNFEFVNNVVIKNQNAAEYLYRFKVN